MQILKGFPSSDVWWVDGVISAPPKSQQRKQAVPQEDFPYIEQEVPGAWVSHRIFLTSISSSGTAIRCLGASLSTSLDVDPIVPKLWASPPIPDVPRA